MDLEQQNTSSTDRESNTRQEPNRDESWKSSSFISRITESFGGCLIPLGSIFSSDLLYILYTCSFILLVMGSVFFLFDHAVGAMIFGPGVFLLTVSVIGSFARWSRKEKGVARESETNRRPSETSSMRNHSESSAVVNQAFIADLPPRYSDIFPSLENRPPSYQNSIPES